MLRFSHFGCPVENKLEESRRGQGDEAVRSYGGSDWGGGSGCDTV